MVRNDKGQLEEKVWKIKGMYGAAIEKIVYWLEKAKIVAENKKQDDVIGLFISYLLRVIQSIKSEGGYEAGKTLVENYGVKVDQKLNAEILEINKQFNSEPYSGFVNHFWF